MSKEIYYNQKIKCTKRHWCMISVAPDFSFYIQIYIAIRKSFDHFSCDYPLCYIAHISHYIHRNRKFIQCKFLRAPTRDTYISDSVSRFFFGRNVHYNDSNNKMHYNKRRKWKKKRTHTNIRMKVTQNQRTIENYTKNTRDITIYDIHFIPMKNKEHVKHSSAYTLDSCDCGIDNNVTNNNEK